MTGRVVIATIAAFVEMTGVRLVVAMPVAAVARVLPVDVRPEEVGRADHVMIAANAANADPNVETDFAGAMIARNKSGVLRRRQWCRD